MTRVMFAAVAALALVLGAGQGRAPDALAGGGGCHSPYTDGSGTRVDLEMNCFVPTVLHVDEGATVEFVSGDEWEHLVTGTAQSWGDWEPVAFGQTVTQRFDASGVYVYFCALHPGMTGAIVVGDGSGAGPAAAGAPTGDGSAAPGDEAATGETQTSDVLGSGLVVVVGMVALVSIIAIGAAVRFKCPV